MVYLETVGSTERRLHFTYAGGCSSKPKCIVSAIPALSVHLMINSRSVRASLSAVYVVI